MSYVFIRTSLPEVDNIYYNKKGTGGISTCCFGNSQHPYDGERRVIDLNGNTRIFAEGRIEGLNVLPNCVGFACGAFNETLNSVWGENKLYFALNCDAKKFISEGKKLKYTYKNDESETIIKLADYIVEYKNYTQSERPTPTVGSILVWGSGTYGHVAYVCKVVDDNTIYTAESNYGWFYGIKDKNGNIRDKYYNEHFVVKPRYRGDGNWGISGCSGFIKNPVVDSNIQFNYAPFIENMKEDTINANIDLQVNVNGQPKNDGKYNYYNILVKYRFINTSDENNAQTPWSLIFDENNTETTIVKKISENFNDLTNLEIASIKPIHTNPLKNNTLLDIENIPDQEGNRLEIQFIQILVNEKGELIDKNGNITEQSPVIALSTIFCFDVQNNKIIPCLNIYNKNKKEFVQYIPTIYTKNKKGKYVWYKVVPYIYSKGNWKYALNGYNNNKQEET